MNGYFTDNAVSYHLRDGLDYYPNIVCFIAVILQKNIFSTIGKNTKRTLITGFNTMH